MKDNPVFEFKTVYHTSPKEAAPEDPVRDPDIPLPRIVPITPKEWERFSEKAKWDCQVALRGPDCEEHWANVLKWFTTSIIRYRMSGVMRVGGLVNRNAGMIVVPRIQSFNKPPEIGTFSLSHFATHVYEAAEYLNIPRLQIPLDVWMEGTKARGRQRAYAPWIEWINDVLPTRWGQSVTQRQALAEFASAEDLR